MKLQAQTYVSPNPKEGTFNNVIIEDTAFKIIRNQSYFKINFEMYLEDKPEVVLETAFLAFQGMDADEINSNRKATFKFNDDTEGQEPRGLIEWVTENQAYPTNFTMVDWGYPTYQQALNYLTGGTFASPEIHPVDEFVKNWILNSVQMKGELIGVQFQFVV
jgi:hypothetical protein